MLFLAIISAYLSVYGWIRRKEGMGQVYFQLLIVLTSWLLVHGFVVASGPTGSRSALLVIQSVLAMALPVFLTFFSLEYAGNRKWKSPAVYPLFFIPVVVLLFARLMGWMSDPVRHVTGEPDDIALRTWDIIQHICMMAFLLAATFILLVTLARNPRPSLGQTVILGTAAIIPWFGNFSFVFGVPIFIEFDLAPYSMLASAGFLAWGLNFRRQLNTVMMARRSVVDRMLDGLVVLNLDNRLIDINSAARSMFGLRKEDLNARPAEDLFKAFPDILENLRYQSLKNQTVRLSLGEEVSYCLLDINPLYDLEGGPLGKMLLLRDITPLKNTEMKLVEAKARAEQSDSLKSAFLANMSHEIRTPMNVIIGFSNLLNDKDVSSEERDEFIRHIKNSGNSLLQLIDDIIDMSKIDTGQISREDARISVTRLLAELYSFFNEELGEAGKSDIQLLVTGISENIDLTLLADGIKINRIMHHLLDNAVKFTKSGFIEFGARMEGPDRIVFHVQDTGIGIAAEKQGMIFERFSRVMTGTRQEYGGTGMGLAICRGLAGILGGTIRVESSLGAGSTFYVSLPVSQVEELPVSEPYSDLFARGSRLPGLTAGDIPAEAGLIAAGPDQYPAQKADYWGNSMLIVLEPDELVYLNIEMILRQTRIKLLWAKSLQEALNYLEKENAADAILANPLASGQEDMAAVIPLLTGYRHIPTVAIIPSPDSPLHRTCLEMGCAAVVPKPILPASLLAALRPLIS